MRRTTASTCIIFLLSILFSPALDAQVVNDTSQVNADTVKQSVNQKLNLSTITITGARSPKILKDATVPIRLISSGEIMKSDVSNVQEMLQQTLPGLEYTYHHSQQPVLDMQGFGGNSILFLTDNERMAGESLDNTDFYRTTMLDIDRIEIIKGAASCLYGSNAMGGIVNLISREPTDPWNLRLNGKWGAHGEQRYSGLFSLANQRISNTTLFQYTTIDNIDLRRPDQISSGDFSEIYGNTSFNLKERIVLYATDQLKFTARGSYFFRERNSSAEIKNHYKAGSLGLRGTYTFSDHNSLNMSYSYDQYDKSDYLLSQRRDDRTYSNVQNTLHAIYQHDFDSLVMISAGIDFTNDYLQSYQFTDSGSHRQNYIAAFAQADWSVFDRVNLVGGIRYENYSAEHTDRLTPKINIIYRLDKVNFRAGYAAGFRAPSLKELYMEYSMPAFDIYGNSELKPELSHNMQVSAEYANQHFSLTVMGFHNIVDNRISTAWFDELNGQRYINMNNMTVSGADISMTAITDFGLSASASYTYTYESIRDGLPITASGRPHSATIRIDYDKRFAKWGYNISVSGRIMSDMDCGEYTTFSTISNRHYPGYHLWKLSAMLRYYKGVTLMATVNNLFDYVPDIYYIKTPVTTGRTFSLSLTLDIDRMF